MDDVGIVVHRLLKLYKIYTHVEVECPKLSLTSQNCCERISAVTPDPPCMHVMAMRASSSHPAALDAVSPFSDRPVRLTVRSLEPTACQFLVKVRQCTSCAQGYGPPLWSTGKTFCRNFSPPGQFPSTSARTRLHSAS